MKMKKIKLTLFVLIGFYNWLSAQPVNESSGTVGQVSIRFNQIVGQSQIMGLNFDYLYKEVGAPVSSFSLKVNLFSSDIIGDFSIKENTSIRLRVGFNKYSFKGNSVINYSSGSKDTYNADIKQTIITIAPGIAEHFKKDKLLFTFGIELPVDFISETKLTSENIYYSAFDSTTSKYSVNVTLDGGFAFGLGTFIGVSYTLFHNFSVGSELSYGIKYVNFGGDVKIEAYDDEILDFSQTDELKIKGFAMIPLKASLVIAYSF